jgi:hypothetical protein
MKHEIETRQVDVDRTFARLDDFLRKHGEEAESDSSTGPVGREAEEKLVLLERLMEAMSRLNASYRFYVQVLEKKIGFRRLRFKTSDSLVYSFEDYSLRRLTIETGVL